MHLLMSHLKITIQNTTLRLLVHHVANYMYTYTASHSL